MTTVAEIIKTLGLKPHPCEGGFYVETYRSEETVAEEYLPERYSGTRSYGTAIYYLLTPETFSELHRLPTDEIFHFYLGDPVTQLRLRPDGSHETVTLGTDLSGGERPQAVVPGGTWQGSCLKPGGRFALLGATLAPSFDFADYEAGDRKRLIEEYPLETDLITRLTRS